MQKMVHNRKSLVLEALQVDEPKTTSDVEINETSREKERFAVQFFQLVQLIF